MGRRWDHGRLENRPGARVTLDLTKIYWAARVHMGDAGVGSAVHWGRMMIGMVSGLILAQSLLRDSLILLAILC